MGEQLEGIWGRVVEAAFYALSPNVISVKVGKRHIMCQPAYALAYNHHLEAIRTRRDSYNGPDLSAVNGSEHFFKAIIGMMSASCLN